MIGELLIKLEQKVEHAVEVIELLRLQLEELEEENAALKAEQQKWRGDLVSMIKRFDEIEVPPPVQHQQQRVEKIEEAYEPA